MTISLQNLSNSEKLESWMRRYADGLKAKPVQPTQLNPHLPKANPIVVPQFNKEYMFLEGELGREINNAVQIKYGQYQSISSVDYNESLEIVEGSTPLYVVAVNEVLREQNISYRTATQADLEQILTRNSLDLKESYEDTSLVWRSNQGINDYLARDIFEQCKTKGINLIEGIPYVFPLAGMSLREDSKSPYGSSFDLGSNIIYFKAPILSSPDGSYINPKEIDDKTGLPKKVYRNSVSGNRQLWTANYGLSGVYLGENLSLYSHQSNLYSSDCSGRVVLVSTKKDKPKNLGAKK